MIVGWFYKSCSFFSKFLWTGMVRLRVDLSETWGEGFVNNIERALDCGFIFSKYKGFFSLQKFEVREGSPGRSDGRRSLLPWPSFGPLIYRSWRYGRSMIRQSTKHTHAVDCRRRWIDSTSATHRSRPVCRNRAESAVNTVDGKKPEAKACVSTHRNKALLVITVCRPRPSIYVQLNLAPGTSLEQLQLLV